MEIRIVAPNYFEVMGIPLLQGRAFGASDMSTAPRVIIVNETLKRRWWQDGAPVGDRVVIGRMNGVDIFKDVRREVVGIAGDTKTVTLQDPPRPTLYLPITQADVLGIRKLGWIVKGNTSLVRETEARQVIDGLDPGAADSKGSAL